MAEEKRFVGRYTLEDLFDRTIAMIRRTWKTSIGLGALVLTIPSVLFGWTLLGSFQRLALVIDEAGPESGAELLWPVFRSMAALPLVGLLVGISAIVMHLVVTDAVRGEVFEGDHDPRAALSRVLRSSLWTVIGQGLIKALLFGALIAIPVAVIVLVAVVFEAGGVWIFLSSMLYVAAIIITVWLWVSLSFAPYATVFDGQGVFGGLSASRHLVRGNWWRVLGYSILIQLIVSFTLGIITTPVVGISLLPTISSVIEASTSGAVGDEEIMRIMTSVTGLGIAAAVGALVQQLLSLLVLPVFYALLFVDLKVRAGELGEAGGEQAEEHV
ncbi:MAG: hypothetical protein ACOC1I_04995 [Spirochaetota bacterium]